MSFEQTNHQLLSALNDCDQDLSDVDQLPESTIDTMINADDCTDNSFLVVNMEAENPVNPVKVTTDQTCSAKLQSKIRDLQNELDESRSLLTVHRLETNDVLETERRKCREELASLERIMNERMQDIQARYQAELNRLKAHSERLEHKIKTEIKPEVTIDKQTAEVRDLKSESMLSAVTKTFRQKVNSLTTVPNTLMGDERNRHVTDDSELFLPYEQELNALKDKLRLTDQRVQTYESVLLAVMRNLGKESVLNSIQNLGDKADIERLSLKFDAKDDNKSLLSNMSDDFLVENSETISLMSQLICENSAIQIQNERLAKEIEELNHFINNGAACRPKNLFNKTNKMAAEIEDSEDSSDTSVFNSPNNKYLLQRTRSLDLANMDPIGSEVKGQPANQECSKCEEMQSKLNATQNEHALCEQTIKQINHDLRLLQVELKREQETKASLESHFVTQAKQTDAVVEELSRGLQAKQQQLNQFRALLDQCVQHVQTMVGQVEMKNGRLVAELEELHRENQVLLGKHLARSDIMARERINLPQKLDEAQEQCLRLREELISVQVAREHIEETYQEQVVFLKKQQQAEQMEKQNLEQTLVQENEDLRNERDRAKGELQAMLVRYQENENHLKDCQEKIASLVQDYQKQVDSLNTKVEQLTLAKKTAEQENFTLKGKVQNLQLELDNSETVQRDFVKLSQTLQVKLEEIRQADTEVRWQHEDDVSNCFECKKSLNYKRDKHNCSHCGKIFCQKCCNKTVNSGPNHRLFHVCQVCHTLLVHDSAPYFSNALPHSPV